jgi:hypothetical protein
MTKPSTPFRAGNLLKQLLNGIPVEIEGENYKMFTTSDGLDLCQVATDSAGEEIGLRLHCTLNQFVNMVDRMTDEQYMVIAANMVLNGAT